MAHYGTLREFRFKENVEDIRGSDVYGRDDEKLGEISDVIFDHSTGDIQYAVDQMHQAEDKTKQSMSS